jgi:hypothetical protein
LRLNAIKDSGRDYWVAEYLGLSSEVLAAIYGGIVGGVLGITAALLGAVVQNRLKRVGKGRASIVSIGSVRTPAHPGSIIDGL